MEKQPPRALADIIDAIAWSDEEKRKATQVEEIYERAKGYLFEQAFAVIKTKSYPHNLRAGGRIADYLSTDAVKFAVNKQQASVVLTEEHDQSLSVGPFPNPPDSTVWFHVRFSHDDQTDRGRTIFKIRKEKVLNWQDEEASLEQLASASSIISFIDQNLVEASSQTQN